MTAIVFEDVSKWFQHRPVLFNWIGKETRGRTEAIRHLSIDLPAGSFIAIVGPNGSGKSTFLKLCSGLILPDEGSIKVMETNSSDLRGIRSQSAFVGTAERSFFGQLTAAENLEFFGTFDNLDAGFLRSAIPRVLAQVGLQSAADLRVSGLSSGNLQRLAFARGLLVHPRLLLLDEPSRSLDPDGVVHLHQLLRELQAEGMTIVMSTHNLDEAHELADRVIALDGGSIVFDRPTGDFPVTSDLHRFYFEQVGHRA